jgi:hypothetical protein
VSFDRALLVEPSATTTIRARAASTNGRSSFSTASSRIAEQIEDLDFVAYKRAAVPEGRPPDGGLRVRQAVSGYRGHIIHVTLRCDFIVDCRRHPVDGNHLAGRLPTGDNVPGGTFESWFLVVDDAEYDRAVSKEQTTPRVRRDVGVVAMNVHAHEAERARRRSVDCDADAAAGAAARAAAAISSVSCGRELLLRSGADRHGSQRRHGLDA